MPDITDPHHVLPVFCNYVAGTGQFNDVANLTFGVAQFTPNGLVIDPDVVVCCRLRMDMQCLQQLYQNIGQLLSQNPQTTVEIPN
jgi:hypothetical protein